MPMMEGTAKEARLRTITRMTEARMAGRSTGRVTRAGSDSSPRSTSRLSSRPTRKKNSAIRPSLTQSSSGLSISSAPTWMWTGVSRNAS